MNIEMSEFNEEKPKPVKDDKSVKIVGDGKK